MQLLRANLARFFVLYELTSGRIGQKLIFIYFRAFLAIFERLLSIALNFRFFILHHSFHTLIMIDGMIDGSDYKRSTSVKSPG